MSGSLSFKDGKMVIENNGRIVSTTEGTLVNLLPAEFDFVQTVSVPKQDWQQETDLADAPAGADIFEALVRINRTAAPSHSWGGNSIDFVQPSNVWVPFTGSMLMEAEVGMARAFSLYLSGGKLKLHRQQSVSVPPGGWGAYGGPAWSEFSPSSGNGGEWVYGSQPGLPVVTIQTRNSAPTEYSSSGTFPPFAPDYKETHRRGGSEACSTSMATNYSSTYQVEIRGKFGRRS